MTKWHIQLAAVTSIACMALSPALAASIAPWTKLASPPGGDAACFVFDTGTPGVVLAGSSGGLIYRSTDGGTSWHAVVVGKADEEFRVIGQSPAKAGVFYAYSTGESYAFYAGKSAPFGSGRVYVSSNDGVSWSALPHQPPAQDHLFRGLGRGIAIDPTGQIIVLSDSFGGILRSTDAGQSWSVALPVKKARPYGLATDPVRPGTLWAAGNTPDGTKAAIWKSTDFGATWKISEPQALNNGSVYPLAYAIAVQPGTGNIYATYEGSAPTTFANVNGVAVSTDGGVTWNDVNTGILSDYTPGSASGGIVFDPTTPSTIYLSDNGGAGLTDGSGFYKSTDNGGHWLPIGLSLPDGGAFVAAARPAMPGYPAAIFAGYPDIEVSTDSGNTWAINTKGFNNAPLTSVSDGGTSGHYFGITVTGVFSTKNTGQSWSALPLWKGSHTPSGLAVDLTRATPPIYVVTYDNLWRTTNGGTTWKSVQPSLGAGLRIQSVLTDASGRLYAIDTGQTLYRSTNEGASWTAIIVGGPSDIFANGNPLVATNAPAGDPSYGTMYANLSSGIWVSPDFGSTWALLPAQPSPSTPGPVIAMAAMHVSPYTLFVADEQGNTDSYTPGQTAFTTLFQPFNNYFQEPYFYIATAPSGSQAFTGEFTSGVIATTNAFVTSSNVATPLTAEDSLDSLSGMSATKSTLFISDYDGTNFALPYTSLPQ